MRTLFAAVVSCLLTVTVWGQAPARRVVIPRFEFKDGDRIALLGDTWVEREQSLGYIETSLTSRLLGKKVIFRNLAWSADTVLGESRASFDPPEKGFDRLKEQLTAIKPTVAMLGYGMVSSFEGDAALPKFLEDLKTLMDFIETTSKPDPVRFIIFSPLRHENLGAPLPDPAAHNAVLKKYSQALEQLCSERNARFVPIFDFMEQVIERNQQRPITDNGIHPSPYGYWRLSQFIEDSLRLRPGIWRVGFGSSGGVRSGSSGMTPVDVQMTRTSATFRGTDSMMVTCPNPQEIAGTNSGPYSLIQFVALTPPADKFALKVDGVPVAVHTGEDWSKGQYFWRGSAYDQIEELRKTIIKKNELFFHRWRPQNETYLFGFRKYEQGQNAREIPMFDPLIAAEEAKIETLKTLKERHYVLTPASDADEKALEPPPAATPRQGNLPDKGTQTQPVFQLDQNLEVTLFAENPNLAKPIHINFDPQGRLWVASSEVYPQIKPGQTANDKILILEDTDRDGKADKTTIFADGLLIPTGVEPGDGGAYVANSTELVHFQDTDGNGYAETRRVLLSGFGTEDTHHILHTLRWGHDGQLYMNQSIYIHSHVETPHGVVRLDSGGILNYRPTTHELGIHLKGLINSWGHHFDKYGQSFATDGAGHEGINWVIPEAMYVTYEGARKILHGVSPGNYPKFCGLEVLESEHFPDDWQGSIVTCDFRANRVVRFAISDQDSGYVTKQMPDLMLSTNVTFRPIDVKVGPDGALYIADWSNPIIQHGEVDFRDSRRDHEMGRIWRVSYKGRPLVKHSDLAQASNSELLGNLLQPNGYLRQRSRRLLTERGQTILGDLAAWTDQQSSEQGQLEALWMYQSIDQVNEPLLGKVLAAKTPAIRAAATRVVSFWRERIANPLDTLEKLARDEDGRVRVEALRAVAKIPESRSVDIVLGALATKQDRFLDYAIWLSINDLARLWIDQLQAGSWKIEGREAQLEYGLNAIEPAQTAKVLATLLSGREIPKDGSGPWIALIGKAGGESELNRLLDLVISEHFQPAAAARGLNALSEAARVRNTRPSNDLARLQKLLASTDEPLQAAAVRLAGSLKLSQFASPLLELAKNEARPPSVRAATFESLRNIGGAEVSKGLADLAAKPNSIQARTQAVRALTSIDLAAGIPLAVAVLSESPDEAHALDLWRALLSNKGAADPLASAINSIQLPAHAAKAGLRAAREGGRNEPNLVLALGRKIEDEGSAQQLSADELKQFLGLIREKGDPARGEQVYRRAELACITCHAIGGVGGKVGPDLTSLGASAQPDYIVESLLFPNRKIKEGYHAVIVSTKDDLEYSGIVVRESDEQLVIRDATNKELSIPKNNIASRRPTGSIMPAGLIDSLPQPEQLDLYRFISELGKPGPFDASKNNVARFVRLLPRTLDLSQMPDDKIITIPLNQEDWFASMTLVDGRIPRSELEKPIKRFHYRDPDAVYIAAQLEMPKAGLLKLKIEGVDKAPVWVDGKLAGYSPAIETSTRAGAQTVVIKIKASALPESVRLSTDDATFLSN